MRGRNDLIQDKIPVSYQVRSKLCYLLSIEQSRISSVVLLLLLLFCFHVFKLFFTKHFCLAKIEAKRLHRQNFLFLNLYSKFLKE